MEQKIMDDLEDLIDKKGLREVLESLCSICYEKADHVALNWQDKGLSRAWKKNGKILDKVSQNLVDTE